MKKLLILFLFISIFSSLSYAERSVDGFERFSDFREIGEFRLWTFIVKDSTIGSLVSTVKDKVKIDGVHGFYIEQKLNLDYNKAGIALTMNIRNQHFITHDGFHLGDEMELNINGQQEELYITCDNDKLVGYVTRGGDKVEKEIPYNPNGFAIENNYFDQLELFLAARNLSVGTTFEDSVYMPQSMVYTFIKGEVIEFDNIQLYNEVFDSSFVIQLTHPVTQTLYFTPDKRLVKVDIPSQNLKVYLDAVQNPEKAKRALEKLAKEKGDKSVGFTTTKPIGTLFGITFVYILFGFLSVTFFIKDGYNLSISYVAMFIGGLIFVVIPFTQIPWQESIFKNYFIPNVLEGSGSAFMWGLLPAFVAGFIQECLKIVSIFLFIHIAKCKNQHFTIIGAMVGLGFGIVEACYLAGGIPTSVLFGVNLVERGFMILFHVTSGALLGYVFRRETLKIVTIVLITIVINSLFRYLPIFAQSKTFTPELLSIVLAIVSITFLMITMLIFKKGKEA